VVEGKKRGQNDVTDLMLEQIKSLTGGGRRAILPASLSGWIQTGAQDLVDQVRSAFPSMLPIRLTSSPRRP
jgi:hypothetical protein